MDLRETRCGLDSSVSEYEPLAGSCDHGDEPLDFIKGLEFLHQLSDYQLLKKYSAPLSSFLAG
jgi:hypothetical protein